jgi:hypothetical protein
MSEQNHRMRPVDSGEPAGAERHAGVSPIMLVSGLFALAVVVVALVWGTTSTDRTGTAANPPASTIGAGSNAAR